VLSLYIVFALFLAVCQSHNHGAHHPSTSQSAAKPVTQSNSVCHYTSTHGVQYDLRLLDHNAVSDLQYYDVASASTFYFRPCGTVSAYHQKDNSCPKDSTVCMVNSAGKAVNFGTNKVVQWADGVEDHASIEAAYGNGETCNNGAARKTFVEYVCNLKKVVAASSIVNVTMIDDCTAKFIIESAYACPVANYCSSVQSSESCNNQNALCKWAAGKCQAAKSCLGYWTTMHVNHSGMFAVILITVTGVLLACTFGLCLCACRRRRSLRANGGCRKAVVSRRCARRSGKQTKTAKKQRSAEQDAEYEPFQMPFQLIPGGFAPINPYSNIQGYPMVTLVAPSGENHEQV